jgi:hypothetical protein
MKTKLPRAVRLRGGALVVVPSLLFALAVVDVDCWFVLLAVDHDRLVLTVDVDDGLSCRSSTG